MSSAGSGTDLFTRGGRGVRRRRPKRRPAIHPGQWKSRPQGHAALVDDGSVEALHQNGAG